MGWFGHGLYDGDGTQTCHIDWIKQAIPILTDDDVNDCLGIKKTIIDKQYHSTFLKGIKPIIKKLKSKTPNNFYKWDDDRAIEWQMMLALFIDNKLPIPDDVAVYGLLGTHILSGEHAADFTRPHQRRKNLNSFIKKAGKLISKESRGKLKDMMAKYND